MTDAEGKLNVVRVFALHGIMIVYLATIGIKFNYVWLFLLGYFAVFIFSIRVVIKSPIHPDQVEGFIGKWPSIFASLFTAYLLLILLAGTSPGAIIELAIVGIGLTSLTIMMFFCPPLLAALVMKLRQGYSQ